MPNPKIALIAAVSENLVIAKDGRLPWHIPNDLKRYREKIANHIIISGRKTFDKSYRTTTNIVITRQKDYVPPISATVVHSLSGALEKAGEIISRHSEADSELKTDEVFIIGGGEIFKESIALADKLYLTLIHKTVDGDTFFPDYSQFTKIVYDKKEESDGYSYEFLDLERE